jgi:hypothetical protein
MHKSRLEAWLFENNFFWDACERSARKHPKRKQKTKTKKPKIKTGSL